MKSNLYIQSPTLENTPTTDQEQKRIIAEDILGITNYKQPRSLLLRNRIMQCLGACSTLSNFYLLGTVPYNCSYRPWFVFGILSSLYLTQYFTSLQKKYDTNHKTIQHPANQRKAEIVTLFIGLSRELSQQLQGNIFTSLYKDAVPLTSSYKDAVPLAYYELKQNPHPTPFGETLFSRLRNTLKRWLGL